MVNLRFFKWFCICFLLKMWPDDACAHLSDTQLFCWALLIIRKTSKSRGPTSLGSTMPQPLRDSSGCDTSHLPIDAVPLSEKEYSIHREEERKQGAMSLFLNDASRNADIWILVPNLLFNMLHVTQHLTENRKSLFRSHIPYLEISTKSCFCAKQLLAGWSSYLATPTCGSCIMKLGTDFFKCLFKWKKQSAGSPRKILIGQM